MLDKNELERRLVGWASEYGGGRYENLGYASRNILQTLIEHGGFVPDARGFTRTPIRNAADEVEQAVRAMEDGGMFKPGRVLRCEYFMPNSAEDARLRNLRVIGLPMSRAGYYIYLGQAKAYISGALSARVVAA
jgi:hypothetical protein